MNGKIKLFESWQTNAAIIADILTHKQLETHGCMLSIVATDALVLKHQTISIHSADLISIAVDQFQTKNITYKMNNITKWYDILQKKEPSCLTHRGRVTHICVSDLIIIGSDNGLSPGRRQAIIRTNAGILLIRP